jgi:hypothetical protein
VKAEKAVNILKRLNGGDRMKKINSTFKKLFKEAVSFHDMNVEQIFSKLEGKITREEFQSRIKEKVDEFGGLLSEEGAALIIAADMGITLQMGELQSTDIRCPECGKLCPQDSIFCENCGTRLEKVKSKEPPRVLEILIQEQDIKNGFIGGSFAASVGAIFWYLFTVLTGVQIGFMGLFMGIFVGLSVKYFGKGVQKKFGYMGAGLSLFACLLGDWMTYPSIVDAFDVYSVIFYVIAIYEGYRFSWKVSKKDIEGVLARYPGEKEKATEKKLPNLLVPLALSFFFFDVYMGIEGADNVFYFLWIWMYPIIGFSYWMFCVHRYHIILKEIFPGYPITPNRAVGYHFIPLYNLFWVFRWLKTLTNFGMKRNVKMINGYLLAIALVVIFHWFLWRWLFVYLYYVEVLALIVLMFLIGCYINGKLRRLIKQGEKVTP